MPPSAPAPHNWRQEISVRLRRDTSEYREPCGQHNPDGLPENQSHHDREDEASMPFEHSERPGDPRVRQREDWQHQVARPRLDGSKEFVGPVDAPDMAA
jgi:hypothetical protein